MEKTVVFPTLIIESHFLFRSFFFPLSIFEEPDLPTDESLLGVRLEP